MKDRSLRELLFYTILIIIMVMSLSFGVKDLSNMDISYTKVALFSIPISIAALIITSFPLLLIPAILAAAGYSVYLYFYQWHVFDLYHTKISYFLYWLQGYIIGYEAFDLKYSLPFTILFMVTAAIAISILTIGKRSSFILIVVGTAAHSFYWFMYVSKAKIYILLFLFSSILIYAYKVYKQKNKEWLNKGNIAAKNIGYKWMGYTSVLLIVSLLMTLLIPFNIKPLRWEWLNDKVVDIFPFVLDWRNDAMDSYGYGFSTRYNFGAGSSKNSKLGGPIYLDDSIMFTLTTDGFDTLYLRGTVKDNYSGSSWSKSSKSYFQYRTNDTLSIPFDLNEVSTYKKKLTIAPKKLLTSTIFAPYKIYKVEKNDNKFFIDEDSEAYFSKLVTRKESYTVESIMPYLNEQELRRVNVNKSVNKEYLQLPDYTITNRVKQLSRELTSGYENDYDKVKAVESYLRANYEYSLNPAPVPIASEFVDHFLFEEKKGYCTYFATAMAVLLRASDIPCRYVEGFLSTYEASGAREIKGSSAHAWVEVCFDKYGWLTFEATPAYSVASFTDKKEDAREVSSIENNSSLTNEFTPVDTNRDKSLLPEEEEAASGSVSKGLGKINIKLPGLIKNILLLLIALRVFSIAFLKALREVFMRKAKGRKFVHRYMKNLLWHFSAMGYKKGSEETLREFSDKISNYVSEGYSSMPEVIDILEGCVYGERALDTSERLLLEKYRKKIRKITINRLGALRFLWRVYILGI